MGADVLDSCKEARREDGSCADKGYVYGKDCKRNVGRLLEENACKSLLRVMRRGQSCQRLEECYNIRMWTD